MVAVDLAPEQARRAVEEFCEALGIAPSVQADVLLCVTEAVTNVVVHAYRDQNVPGQVSIEAFVDDHLCIRVVDAGAGIAPRDDSPGLGLGLPIMEQLSETLEVLTPEGGGAEVVMKFAIA